MKIGSAGFTILADNEYKLFKIRTDNQVQTIDDTNDTILFVERKLVHSTDVIKWSYEKAGKWIELPLYLDSEGEEVDLTTDYSQLTLPSDYSIWGTKTRIRAEMKDVDGFTYFDEITLYRLSDESGIQIVLSNEIGATQTSTSGDLNLQDLNFQYFVYNNKTLLVEGDGPNQFAVKHSFADGEMVKNDGGYTVSKMNNTFSLEQKIRLSFTVRVPGKTDTLKTSYFYIINGEDSREVYFSESNLTLVYDESGNSLTTSLSCGLVDSGTFLPTESYEVIVLESYGTDGLLERGADSWKYVVNAMTVDESEIVIKILSGQKYAIKSIPIQRQVKNAPSLTFSMSPSKLSFTYNSSKNIKEVQLEVKGKLQYGGKDLVGSELLENLSLVGEGGPQITVQKTEDLNFFISMSNSELVSSDKVSGYFANFSGVVKIKGYPETSISNQIPITLIQSSTVADELKKEIQDEISQAVDDWNTEFEEAKQNIDNSIENVSKELGEYIKSTDEIIAEHDDLLVESNNAITDMNTEISNTKNNISDLFESTEANRGAIVTVSNNLGTLSTKVSNVETTANTANTTASEVKQTASGLTSTVSSLQGTVNTATGDITKLKSDVTTVTQTATGLSSKVTSLESDNVTNKQNIASVTQTADGLKNEVSSVTTTANTALAKATTVEQTASGLSSKVTSLEKSDSTQNSNISSLQQTASGLTSTVSSHTSSINGLNSTVSTHSSEIKQTSDKISMVVSNGSTASAVQLTPNALTAIAKDINLKGNVQFNSLVEGDGTNTQILGGKIKTGSISASKLMISGNSSLVKFLQSEYMQGADFKPVAAGQQSVIRKEGVTPVAWLVRETESNAVKFTDFNSATITSGSIQLVVKYRLDSDFSTSDNLIFEIHGYDRFGDWVKTCYRSSALSSGNVEHKIKIDYTTNELHHFGIRFRLADNLDIGGRNFTLSSFSLLEMNAGELIVDGAIKANHIVSGSAELGAVTSKVLSTEALNAAWANIGNAFINKLTSDDALFQRLTAKSAWITSANIVSLEASRIKGGTLQSTNGLLSWNLDNSYLRFSGASNAMEYVFGGNSVGIRFGDLYSKVLSKTVPTVSLYANAASTDASNIRIDLIAQEQQINIRGDRISFYDHDTSVHGFHVDTTHSSGGQPWDSSIRPFTAGQGSVGVGGYSFYEVKALNIVDVYTNYALPMNYSVNRAFSQTSSLDVVNSCNVTTFFVGNGETQLLNAEDDTIERASLAIDFTPLRLQRTTDARILFNEQNEMTLNTEIAILWKAVQELSEQNKKLQEQINELKGA